MSCSKAKAAEMDRTAEDSISLNELDRRVEEQRERMNGRTVIATEQGQVLMTVDPTVKAPGYQGPALPPDPGPALADMDLTCLSSAHQERAREVVKMLVSSRTYQTVAEVTAMGLLRDLLGEG